MQVLICGYGNDISQARDGQISILTSFSGTYFRRCLLYLAESTKYPNPGPREGSGRSFWCMRFLSLKFALSATSNMYRNLHLSAYYVAERVYHLLELLVNVPPSIWQIMPIMRTGPAPNS